MVTPSFSPNTCLLILVPWHNEAMRTRLRRCSSNVERLSRNKSRIKLSGLVLYSLN